MNLRERCEEAFRKMGFHKLVSSEAQKKRQLSELEAFAREIRNEALDQAIRCCESTTAALSAADLIRALKDGGGREGR